ncbi:hypothetical protein AWN76_001470 [Rhodothermaceae bacterium RA]|nr:hypothetical protein AWN76_001470 [Rhodothermaceae bacterium RA]
MEPSARRQTSSVGGPDDGVPFPPQSLYARLLREGYRFNFYQAVRLLERLFPEAPKPGTSGAGPAERIRFRPDHAMVFPAADIRRVTWHDGPVPHVELVATFLGLYGIDAPMPPAFFEPITLEQSEAEPLKAFLDLFNQRFYAYFYRAWKKYRPNLHDSDTGQQADLRRFLAVAGLGTPGAAAPPTSAFVLSAFAARLVHRPRNAEGLRSLVQSLLGEVPVHIQEFVPTWVPLPHRGRLGRRAGMRLGEDALLGERVYDVAGTFRIRLGPLGLETYLSLLPGGTQARRLRDLVCMYTAHTLAYDVELVVRAAEMPRLRLGDRRARLGLTTCLGATRAGLMHRVVSYPTGAA